VSELSRREFLTRTGALAGAIGAASVLPAKALIKGSSRVGEAPPIPDPRNMPVDTFVVLMMENRSFDHYFGSFPGADGKNAGLTYPDANGNPQATHHLAGDFQGCGFADPNHGWDGSRQEFNNGKLDGFFTASDAYALGYYLEDDLPFIPHAARAFTLYDRYFASLLGSTYPNRHYMWSAQCGGTKTNELPIGSLGQKWETIFDRAQGQGVSVGYYSSDIPFALLYGTRALPCIRPVAEFYVDAALGRLPNICFVDPAFTDGGGGNGLSGDEHPHGDIRIGQAFMSDITHAFISSPQWRSGAMFINYDEWGGFFDHVSPQSVPDDRASTNLEENFGITGFRVPGVAISPYARRGHVSHMTVTHESILKLISYRFGLGYLNMRHRYASNIGQSFDWANPDFNVPDLPDPSAPIPLGIGPGVTAPCDIGGAPRGGTASGTQTRSRTGGGEDVELNSQTMIDYVERVGFDYKPWKPSDIFSKPDSVVQSLQGSN
jgi:phospholipase C